MEPRAHRACKDEQGWAGLGPSGEPPERGERGRGCRAEHGAQSTEPPFITKGREAAPSCQQH